MYPQVSASDKLLRGAVEYVVQQTGKYQGVNPKFVGQENYEKFKTYWIVHEDTTGTYLNFVTYDVLSSKYILAARQVPIRKVQRPVFLEKEVTETGRVNIVSNSVETLTTVDEKFTQVFEKIQEQVPVKTETIQKIYSKETTIGNTYTVLTKTENVVTEVNVVYDKKT